jgi:hypothetical protein
LGGRPTGVRCRGEFTFYQSGGGDARATQVVDFALPDATSSGAEEVVDVDISFVSYDAGTGQVIFRILNGRHSPALECVNARIVNASSGASYFDGYSNAPFAPSVAPVPFNTRLEPEQEAYLKYVLSGRPTDVRCRARFDVYAGESRTGALVTKVVDFTAPAASGGGTIGANISYHSFDRSSGWVTLRVVNSGGVALESAEALFNAPGGAGVLYGPGTSNSPFRDSPTSNTLVDSVAPGATKYLRYKLRDAPSGTAVAATIKLYSGEDKTGQSMTRTVGFTLP